MKTSLKHKILNNNKKKQNKKCEKNYVNKKKY